MSKKFEQLLEYVVNDETDKAQALFHEIVVEKSREIYENLIADEADVEEDFGGDQTESLMNEIEAEEYGDMSEADEKMDDMEDPEMDSDEDVGDDMGHDDEESAGGMEDMEDRLVDLEDALSQLKSEFDGLMSKDGDSEDDMGDDDMGDDDMSGEEDMGDEEEMDEDAIFEYKDHAPKPVLAEPAGTHATSPLAKNAKSPTGAGKPIAARDGSQGNHGVKTPGKLTSYDTTGAGTKMKKVQDMKNI
jgi:hypothetical protein